MGIRKGYFFSLDALVAMMLLFVALAIIPNLYFHKSEQQHLNFYSEDIIQVFSSLKVGELQDNYTLSLIANGTITDLNNTILEQLGEFWALGQEEIAKNMIQDLTSNLIPEGYNVDIVFGGDIINENLNEENAQNLVSSRKLISGIKEGEAVVGYATRVFLSGINGQSNTAYSFFGGYVGDGTIIQRFELPEITSIESAYLELNAGNNFDLYINDKFCQTLNKTSSDSLIADKWDINDSCLSLDYFQSGLNELKFVFQDNSSNYIGGGFFKVKYESSELNLSFYSPTIVEQEWLPGIEGVINLFSSFYTPGELNDLQFYLHFFSNYTVYLNVGNVTVFESDVSGSEQEVILNNLSSHLDLSSLGEKTVPIRLGTRNISLLEGISGRTDVALITDRTPSMSYCDVDSPSCNYWDCSWAAGCQNRRKDIAMDSDKVFINTILGVEGNTLGLVGYGERESPVCSFSYLTEDNDTLIGRIEDYNYNNQWQECGWTCISCGVVGATKLLMENQALYNLTVISDKDTTQYHVGDSGSGVSVTETLTVNFNRSKFVKGTLTILGRNVDTDYDFKNCIYINGNYIGRMCMSNSAGVYGWHTCSFPLKPEWINDGDNFIKITGGTTSGCENTKGENDDWDFKDVELRIWELNTKYPESISNALTRTCNINEDDIQCEDMITLPELSFDDPNPVDLTNGVNSTANTYGAGAGDDGWDWTALTGNSCVFSVTEGRFNISVGWYDGGWYGDWWDVDPDECAYGVQFYISEEIYSHFKDNGNPVMLSFDYEWDGNDGAFETDDQVWIKARLTSPITGSHMIGTDLDSEDNGGDTTNEIESRDDPNNDFSGSYLGDISELIDGPGWYYLELWGKLKRDDSNEIGYFFFDNIDIFENYTLFGLDIGEEFSKIKSAQLRFEALDVDPSYYDCIYINDNYIGRIDFQEWSGINEWQEIIFDVPTHYLRNGANKVVFTGGTTSGCNRTSGTNDDWQIKDINLSVIRSNESKEYNRIKSMLIMSDGEANTKIGDCRNYGSVSCPTVTSTPTPSEETIQKACEAHELYNISIYAIAFGDLSQSAIDTLNQSACCDNCANFYSSNDADELLEIYERIANEMLILDFQSQQVNISGEISNSILFPDSYIEYNYTPSLPSASFGNIPITIETSRFENNITEGVFEVNPELNILEAKVISYSGDSWTDYLSVNDNIVYNLSEYSDDYLDLGDPYIVNIPPELIISGTNNVTISTGISPENSTGGSSDNKAIYTVGLNIDINYSGVKGIAEGCKWFLEFEDGTNDTIFIPSNYSGSNNCTYDYPEIIYEPNSASEDAINIAVAQLLTQLDFDNDGLIDVNFDSSDLEMEVTELPGVPFLWGPTIVEVRTWQ